MGLKLYNTLTRSLHDFNPLKGNKVRMYSCGPTVYDYSHIGNFRSFLFVDLLKRYLLVSGYEVEHVINITDVDDRIIKRCAEGGISLEELTRKFREAFLEDSETLGIIPATVYPHATGHIREMQELITSLIDGGYAYPTDDGSVFFKVSSFPDYGKLSRIDLATLSRTERVLSDHYDKEHARDFSLWKGWKKKDGEVLWDSPWGKGRPGWHIECSAMSMKYLGEEFDIHSGGVDLIFPHHENEIAQSVCGTGKHFVNFWIHSEHLLVDGKKMSKSLGNYYTLRDLLDRGISPLAIRYLLTSAHYRQWINLTYDEIQSATNSVERLQDFRRRLEAVAGEREEQDSGENHTVVEEFRQAMDRDLNVSEAMAAVFSWIREVNRELDTNGIDSREASEMVAALRKIDSVMGVMFVEDIHLSEEERDLIKEREEEREKKRWKRADEIRQYFRDRGIHLDDTPEGTLVKRALQKGNTKKF